MTAKVSQGNIPTHNLVYKTQEDNINLQKNVQDYLCYSVQLQTLNEQQIAQREETSRLLIKRDELNKQFTDLQGKRNELNNQFTDLQGKRNELNNQFSNLQSKSDEMTNRTVVLQGKQTALHGQAKTIQDARATNQTEIDEIKKKEEENKRNAVKNILPKVFNSTFEILSKHININDLDLIGCNLSKEKQCLIVDEVGMDKVIIPIIKGNSSITLANLSLFKDEIHGRSLIKLFEAIPETNVRAVVIPKVKPLSLDEKKAIGTAQQKLKNLGQTLKIAQA